MATFSVVPGLYRQLYTISYFREHHVFPCIFGLLKNKSFETYNFIFKTIMCLVGVLNPTVIKTDYEISAITALTSIWPNARINGCLFHLGQAIDRKIKGLN
ncbi:Protein FAR-RED IMPAIRED RESPONSE 1, partial [Nosema granulosis]